MECAEEVERIAWQALEDMRALSAEACQKYGKWKEEEGRIRLNVAEHQQEMESVLQALEAVAGTATASLSALLTLSLSLVHARVTCVTHTSDRASAEIESLVPAARHTLPAEEVMWLEREAAAASVRVWIAYHNYQSCYFPSLDMSEKVRAHMAVTGTDSKRVMQEAVGVRAAIDVTRSSDREISSPKPTQAQLARVRIRPQSQ